jgi:hypothetical protein
MAFLKSAGLSIDTSVIDGVQVFLSKLQSLAPVEIP